jgi:hypothetical protein
MVGSTGTFLTLPHFSDDPQVNLVCGHVGCFVLCFVGFFGFFDLEFFLMFLLHKKLCAPVCRNRGFHAESDAFVYAVLRTCIPECFLA